MLIHNGAGWNEGVGLAVVDSGLWWIGTWGRQSIPIHALVRDVVYMPQTGNAPGILPIQNIQILCDTRYMVEGKDEWLGDNKEALIGIMVMCLN